jgi:hypothetical protein
VAGIGNRGRDGMTEIYTHRRRRGKRRKKQRPKMTRLRLPFYTSSVKMLGFCIVHGVTYVQPKTARTNRITPKMSLATVCQNAAQPPKNRVICEASKGERRGAEKMLEASSCRCWHMKETAPFQWSSCYALSGGRNRQPRERWHD